MRNAELAEMRALLRAQAAAQTAEPPRKGLFSGVKSLLQKPAQATKPLDLTPLAPPPFAAAEETERAPEVDATVLAASESAATATEDAAPMLYLAPRRARFGLADEGARPLSAPMLRLRPVEADAETDYQPRRRGPSLAATEAAGVGADEILELHELLAERMPHLLEQIDLEAKIDPAPPADPDEPSIACVVSAIEAARASVERTAAREAWAEAQPGLQALLADRSPAAPARRRRLAGLHAELSAHCEELDGDLQAVRRARSRPMSRAA